MEKKKLKLKKIKIANLSPLNKSKLQDVKGGGGETNYQCTANSAVVVYTYPPGGMYTGNTQGSCYLYDFTDGEGNVCTTTASS